MQQEQIERLRKDLKHASATLSASEARFLVDAYYMMQEDRKRAHNQIRALAESEEPHEVLNWLAAQSKMLESQIKRSLDAYSASNAVGIWARGIVGIGPVIAAGLLAYIDITKAPTVGHIWRYAGLDPTSRWEKGQKRPWNASLKTLCWKIGESFVKTSNHPNNQYGRFYVARKEMETRKNEAGDYADQATEALQRFNYNKETDAYKHYSEGRLPPARIHARAKRYATKLFLAHYHQVAYEEHFEVPPPLPYPIAHLGHAHMIEVPDR